MASTKKRNIEVKSAMVEILNLAIDLLWDGVDQDVSGDTYLGICTCISMAGLNYLNYTHHGNYSDRIKKEVDWLCARITQSFGGKAGWVDDWLLWEGHITVQQYNDRSLIQAYRKRWLESLRAEYS